MRLWIASLFLCCFAVAGYSQETTTEAPKEITSAEEEKAAPVVDSHKDDKPEGCGCGKPNRLRH